MTAQSRWRGKLSPVEPRHRLRRGLRRHGGRLDFTAGGGRVRGVNKPAMFDTGDVVRPRSGDEEWVVACVDGEYLYLCGWPSSRIRSEYCELIRKASDSERDELLRLMSGSSDTADHRTLHARRRMAAEGGEG